MPSKRRLEQLKNARLVAAEQAKSEKMKLIPLCNQVLTTSSATLIQLIQAIRMIRRKLRIMGPGCVATNIMTKLN